MVLARNLWRVAAKETSLAQKNAHELVGIEKHSLELRFWQDF